MSIVTILGKTFVSSILLLALGLIADHALAACPASGLTASSGATSIDGNCTIVGDISLSGSATLTVTSGTLSISGNLVLGDDSKLKVTNGTLAFKQTTYYQYYIALNGRSELSMTDSSFVTNDTDQNNFSMSLDAYDSATVFFSGSQLNTKTGSWLLASFHNKSKLSVTNTQNLPTEVYPSDAATISVSSSTFASLWLDLASGDKGTVNIPRLDARKNFDLAFTPSQGHTYSVNVKSSNFRIGLNSHPNSSLTVNGNGLSASYSASIVIGYYIENTTSSLVIDQLVVNTYITKTFSHQGRTLALKNVYLNPFAWQVYVERTNGFTVTIKNSKINELAAFTNGLVDISNSTLQLAVTGAVGPGSRININSSRVWSQSLQAMNGGKINVTNSEIHGNHITASGAGSGIAMTNVTEYRNGIAPQSCAPIGGYSPNINGVPLCNPFNPLYLCSQMKAVGGATITTSTNLACTP